MDGAAEIIYYLRNGNLYRRVKALGIDAVE